VKKMIKCVPQIDYHDKKTTINHKNELAARQIYPKCTLHLDLRRTSKSFTARPCNHPFGCKTHASLPTRTPPFRQISYIMTNPARLPELANVPTVWVDDIEVKEKSY
jgi:hypothetical protein